MTVDRQRQEAQPAFILHTYPYRETSLVAEVFTRNFGRLPLLAKGARRPNSALRGLLRPFQPLQLSWGGKGELRVLHKAEWQGGLAPLQGTSLICGFYLNELLMRLLHRNDPHEQLFVYYQDTLAALGASIDYMAILRGFEQRLLQELGYALTLDHDVASGESIDADEHYCYEIERGPIKVEENDCSQGLRVSGKTLLDMKASDYSSAAVRQQSKALMRYILNHYLDDQPLHTRQLLKDLQQL